MTYRIPCCDRQWKIWNSKRDVARNWQFTEACAEVRPLFFTPWNKDRMKQQRNEWRESLFGGLDRLKWMETHRSWFYQGQWNEAKKARPVWLTPNGKAALKRHKAIEAAGGIG
ncbi:MAG: hypothetical protein ABL936_19130 [Aestuariivirga sp.]